MTDDLGREIHERLRRAELPRAPDRLHRRVATVAGTAPAAAAGWSAPRRLGLLVPLAAVLVVAASVALSSSGGGRSRGSDWGPLAIANAENGEKARTVGRLVVTESCVYLERHGQQTLLVWPAGRTTWDDEKDAITFRRASGDPLTLTSGRDIAVAGSGSSRAEDGLSDEAWLTRQSWVSSPAPGCITDARWLLSDVTATSAEDPVLAALTVTARVDEGCRSIGGCAYTFELIGSSGSWTADVTATRTSTLMDIEPELPASLPSGSYAATASILIVSDVTMNGAQRRFGAGSCTTPFEVDTADRRVRLEVVFNGLQCSIAANG